jgi:hypothetical protein
MLRLLEILFSPYSPLLVQLVVSLLTCEMRLPLIFLPSGTLLDKREIHKGVYACKYSCLSTHHINSKDSFNGFVFLKQSMPTSFLFLHKLLPHLMTLW